MAASKCHADDPKAHPAVLPYDEELDTADRRQARRSWAQLIGHVYEVDPLTCQERGGEMRILAFLLKPVAVCKILTHLARQPRLATRDPPAVSPRRVHATA